MLGLKKRMERAIDWLFSEWEYGLGIGHKEDRTRGPNEVVVENS